MKSIRSKVLASILLITLLTAAAITAVFYWKSAQLVEENYVAVLYQKEQLLIETIDRTMEQVCHINVEASCDEELKSNAQLYLQSGEEQHLEQLAEILGIYAKRNTQISSLYFLMPENAVLVTSKEYPVYKRGLNQRLLKEVLTLAREQTGLLVLPDMGSKDSKVLAFAEPVTDGEGQLLGYLFANMEETRLYYDYLAPKEEDLIKEMVLLKGEQIIASGGLGEVGSIYEKADTHKEWMQGSDMAGADEENIYIYCKGSFSQCGLFAEVEREKILGDLTQIRNYFFGMMGVILLLSLLPAFYITHVVYSPLKKLTSTMRRVSEGELENRAEVVSQDEIGVLAADFNRMLDRIEELIHQLITEEKNKKDAELEALQYQITPHFMYNTLNSIKCAAMIKGDRELGNIIGNFVELLQAAISKKGTFLTVAEEVHILQNYIHLQEFRYGGQFHVSYEIAGETQQCLIPRLLLQPLVENALLHGMDMKDQEGKLIIQSVREGDVLCLKVIDNGRGMSQEQINALLTGEVRKTNGLTAIGIPNIRERLKLYYGEAAGMAYESSPLGTTAMIHLPAAVKEE